MFYRIFLLFGCVLLLLSSTYADTNGVWIDAKDIRSGTFGSNEGDGNFIFPNNVEVSGNFTTPIIETRDLVSNNIDIMGNEGSLRLIGVNHSYIEFYPQGLSSGRKSWFGFETAGSTDFTMQVDISSNILLNPNGGYVGIGTDAPNSELDVNGDLNANDIYRNGDLVATNTYVNSRVSSLESQITTLEERLNDLEDVALKKEVGTISIRFQNRGDPEGCHYTFSSDLRNYGSVYYTTGDHLSKNSCWDNIPGDIAQRLRDDGHVIVSLSTSWNSDGSVGTMTFFSN